MCTTRRREVCTLRVYHDAIWQDKRKLHMQPARARDKSYAVKTVAGEKVDFCFRKLCPVKQKSSVICILPGRE